MPQAKEIVNCCTSTTVGVEYSTPKIMHKGNSWW